MKNERYLERCAQLANLADSRVGDSPRVGAVLVHQDRIIGEGYHQIAGQAHAEVNCLASVRPADRPLIPEATLFISLEPCCIVGRSGACTNVIKAHGIKSVVFAQRDSTPGVNGASVAILEAAGVAVTEYPAFQPTLAVNAHRRVMALKERPFVSLKFAQSADGFLRPADRSADYWITNPISRRLVHRWRANTSAIIVGGRTVVEDDPSLTTRLFPGRNALAVIIDPRNRVSGNEKLFTGSQRPLLFAGSERKDINAEVVVMGKKLNKAALTQVLTLLMEQRLGHVTVEGGAGILQAFIRAGLWDETRVFTGKTSFRAGVPAPELPAAATRVSVERVGSDLLEVYSRS
ncbi:bifunctional diaminohydroxyphosphoribosylaminopyrimidine deaminase/5-amino-6-(5-phosphoribosylamino)uracil reductase RibD [Neolewinella agarilytica]|uniref:bifunctional diaminohydroxyphosphoribosylaminopyrimidine deaminase/5-amino-6-(5-phosphoribosylamino)uracil reductase RibD n=1 Tax=Neolewinella agarilytica TaxID=478744 RepID=UPI002353E196|nr:bifunctional diaminohydroxyphosphoribosylaminopyrimidine deaminase/5-amino-6-(5-phosphoribosylamino)uracil reductase RibD [Neolewinella agarilytica]